MRRKWLGLLLVGAALAYSFILPSPADAGASVMPAKLWKPSNKIIYVVVCTELESTLTKAKQCRDEQLLDAKMTALAREAIALWKQRFEGHIHFEEVKSWQPDVVKIFAAPATADNDCHASSAGYVPGRPPTLQLGHTCGFTGKTPLGTVTHELGHIVGLHHEQRRPDRDTYLKVDEKTMVRLALNKRRVEVAQYHRLCSDVLMINCAQDFVVPGQGTGIFTTDLGQAVGEYDFGSTMHYRIVVPIDRDANGNDRNVVAIVGLKPAAFPLLKAQGMREQAPEEPGQDFVGPPANACDFVGQRCDISPGDTATIKTLYPKGGQ